MRTLALALSVAVLGTGCFVDVGGSDDCLPSTLTVEWSTFTTGDGARLGCSAAGVSFVDIFMNGTPVERWSCGDGGALITDVQPGTYLVTVEGVEASGRIAFRDEQNVSATSCGGRYMRAEPAEGYAVLEYSFAPDNVCFADPSYLWFSVYDEVAQATTAAVDDASTVAEKRLYQCSLDVAFPLPSGPHTLDWMQEMEETSLGVFTVRAGQCARTPFDVPRGGTVGVPVVMTDRSTSCL